MRSKSLILHCFPKFKNLSIADQDKFSEKSFESFASESAVGSQNTTFAFALPIKTVRLFVDRSLID